jgi:hypothetical protein
MKHSEFRLYYSLYTDTNSQCLIPPAPPPLLVSGRSKRKNAPIIFAVSVRLCVGS